MKALRPEANKMDEVSQELLVLAPPGEMAMGSMSADNIILIIYILQIISINIGV